MEIMEKRRQKVEDHYAGPYTSEEEKKITALVTWVSKKLVNLETFVGQYNNEVPVKRKRTAGGLSRRVEKLFREGKIDDVDGNTVEKIKLFLSRKGAEQVADDKKKRKLTISAEPHEVEEAETTSGTSTNDELDTFEYLLAGVRAKKLTLSDFLDFAKNKKKN